jgi:NAD(P)-dependent dehydrogenase (short-subunit alcohol dehydrogenase family)
MMTLEATMAGKLADKTAIITGATGGIGRTMCERFAAEGARVVLASRGVDEMTRIAAHIMEQGGQTLVCRCDVTDASSAQAVVDKALSEYGRLDILVNNAAAFTQTIPFDRLSEEDWEKTISVNLTGTFHMSRFAVQAMKKTGGGIVIHVSSQLARVAAQGQAAYCMSKAALVHLAKAMAIDLARYNIRVNSLSPGAIAGSRLERRFGDMNKAEQTLGPKALMGRLGTAEEVARSAVFLASDDASFMTGSDLLVDGGYTAW